MQAIKIDEDQNERNPGIDVCMMNLKVNGMSKAKKGTQNRALRKAPSRLVKWILLFKANV